MKRSLLLAVVVAALSCGKAFAGSGGSFWLPPRGSWTNESVDTVFYLIFYVAAFFFALIVVLMVAFVILYRRRPGGEPQPSPSHNTPLEIAWTVIPLGLVIVIFYMGFASYLDMRVAPRRALKIDVSAKKWSWTFKYPNGYVDEELHVPVNEPVRLKMTSRDVVHSLFIPTFRVKTDLVPGRYTTTWFRAKTPGQYDLLCAEYCGTGHSDMVTSIVVHEPGEFEPWLRDADEYVKNLPPVEAGRKAYRQWGCSQCHTVDGSYKVGPSFKGIYGQTHEFTDGTSAEVEDNYIKESILDPSAKVRKGYRDQMPPYQKDYSEGNLTDNEIEVLIKYIESLK